MMLQQIRNAYIFISTKLRSSLYSERGLQSSNIPSKHLLVRVCVCPVHCGKTADRIWMQFGIVGRMGQGEER